MATINPALEPAAADGTPDQPVADAQRLVSLDFIRGIAVLGILFANITAFGQPFYGYFWPDALAEPATAGDKYVWLFQTVFVDNKFRGLFSLLFGAGIYLFLERAWSRGRGRALQFRRLAILGLFGVAHYFLIWRGDILTIYAFSGMLALAFVRFTARSQLFTGLGLYVFGLLLMTAMMGANLAAATVPAFAEQMDEASRNQILEAPNEILETSAAEVTLYRDGGYLEIVEKVVKEDAGMLVQQVLMVGLLETLGLVLIGMGLYRMGFFGGAFDARKMKLWGWIGVIVGAVVTVPIALMPYQADFPFYLTLFVFNGIGRVGQLPMVLGLAALLVLWAPTATQGWLGSRFSAAGRMAFSNYLGTSIVMMFVFHGWALGLFGYLHRVELFGVVLLAWAAMLAWSKLWLARYRYGPLEWLWRCMTYGRAFALRR